MNANSAAPPSDPKPPEFRIDPQNEEAEQALLGALLSNNRTFEKVSEFLKAEHFYRPVHGRIYTHIASFIERGQAANAITLKSFFDSDPDLAQVGGAGYLAVLSASVVAVLNAEDYGRTIHNHFLRRQLIAIGEDMVNEAYSHDLDVSAQDQIEEAEKQLFELATTGDIKGGFVQFNRSLTAAIDAAESAYRRSTHITGVTTGLTDLDRKLGGLHKSDLVILAGRPSMGKTALATNIAVNAAKAFAASGGSDGATVGVFSLEMSAEQLATRVLADETRVPGDKIRRGELKDSDFPRFMEANQALYRLPLFIDDTPGVSVNLLRTRARRLKRTANLGMIVIDYLQLMRGSGTNRSENRVQEISEITRGLKAVAKELQIPVLALSQLSRAVEAREDKRPQLADLRESGSIEQDADVVMFVYREQYYLERAEPSRRPEENDDKFNERYLRWQQRLAEVHNVGECVIAKQRHGPIGTVKMHFDGQFTRFSDLESDQSDHDHE
ncbi:MAG: replicative DNA helicase [Rhodospirillaceae bacterium]